MKTSLSAFVIGLAMLSSAGIAQAADVAQTNTQSNAAPAQIVIADAKTPKTGNSQNDGRVALTDDQMSGVTAGHYDNPHYPHYGWYKIDLYGYSWVKGWHY
jgi:hypothetical protein